MPKFKLAALPGAMVAAALAAAPVFAQHGPPPGGSAPGAGPNMLSGPRMTPPLFISPLGEPFRDGSREAGLERWFARADADADGALVPDELRRDSARFYASLDMDRDGEIEPSEMARYEFEIAPEIQVGRGPMSERERRDLRRFDRREQEAARQGRLVGRDGRTPRMLEGASRFGLLDVPQPVMDADADLNRGVTAAELAAAADRRFALLDSDADGRLTRPELLAHLPRPELLGPKRKGGRRR